MQDVLGLVNLHNCPELGPLTANRPLASTSFLGRFAFIDFCLSNFTNSEIGNVGILVKDHQRSILKHLGNMTSWMRNTKTGMEQILYNEKGVLNPPYNHDISNIKENDWVLYSSKATYLVFLDPHIVARIDLRPIIEQHIARREMMTIVYTEIDNADVAFLGENEMEVDEDGYLVDCNKNVGAKKNAKVSMGCCVVNRTALAEIIKRHGSVNPMFGMKQMIPYLVKTSPFKIHTYEHKGYARCFSSLEDYVRYSFELLDSDVYEQLFSSDWPIYTLTHDTPPALYDKNAEVVNSFVANGCTVHGTVRHSILSREVTIGHGAVVEDSIVFSDVSIGKDAKIKRALVDKYSVVTERQVVEGEEGKTNYVRQGAII